ncbi:hypothetical protein ACFYRN_13890 [Streptomyces sp. NPDC005227]|uniref:hypothetical protein n=1 Tax=Streptomyces sp. NPDC005227 TaxID=3364707 RepID=UPI00369F5DC2
MRSADTGRFGRSEGSFVPCPDAAHHVFVGDEAASVAFGSMPAALPGSTAVSGCPETRIPEDRLLYAERLDWTLPGTGSLADAVPGRTRRRTASRTWGRGPERARRERDPRPGTGRDRRTVVTKPFSAAGKRELA